MSEEIQKQSEEVMSIAAKIYTLIDRATLAERKRCIKVSEECRYQCAEHGLEFNILCADCNEQRNVNMMLNEAIVAIEKGETV